MSSRWMSKPLAVAGAVLLLAACADSSISPTASHDVDASFAAAESTTEDVVMFATGAVAGTSKLVRNKNGVAMTFRTSGLDPGTVATIWWVIFNNPGACAGGVVAGVEYRCAPTDIPNPDVNATVLYAAGHVIGGSGKANYGGSLPVGRLTVNPDPDANQLIAGNGILVNALAADVHLVLRTHGEALPGLINQQVKTFDAGCTTAPPALQGPNTCMNLQFAAHTSFE